MPIRVIAGNARGRVLKVPSNAAVRPTGDLVRGVIFSMLEAEAYKRGFEPTEEALAAGLAWPKVLDLYAGSGALGIEALSRGAAEATFVEQDRAVASVLRSNLERLGLESGATVRVSPVAHALASLRGPFDLVLMDPPYADEDAAQTVVRLLAERTLVSPAGVVVVEQRRGAPSLEAPSGLRVLVERAHGGTRVVLLQPGRPKEGENVP